MSGKATAHELGVRAEDKAQSYLEAKGFEMLARNYRGGGGELDLVALDGGQLVFVEVKARKAGSAVRAEEAVDAVKRGRLVKAAEAFLAGWQGPQPVCRFDVVALEHQGGRARIRHLKDAFRPGD